MPTAECDWVALAHRRRPLMTARPGRYVAYQIRDLREVLPVFVLLALEFIELGLVQRPLAVAKSL